VGAVLISLGLQLLVLEAPVLQRAFGTVALGPDDWLRCALVASSVAWAGEASKVALRWVGRARRAAAARHRR
jgi:Ca2+-transporting ATPase